jgi:peptidoglycan L-alanyl-D-glutamate endopeptidase CwlK
MINMAEIDVTVMVKDLDQLNPIVEVMANLAIAEIEKNKVDALVTETYRPQDRQYYLYCKDRTVEQAVAGGVPRDKAVKYVAQLLKEKYTGPKVTWTVHSIHIQKRALDVVPQRKVNGKMQAIWNIQDPDTKKIIAIMTKYGFEAGANWKSNTDSPHYQVDDDITNLVDKTHTTKFLTKAIQNALIKAGIDGVSADGVWGAGTDKAVSAFRTKMKYKSTEPSLGATALKALLNYL